MSNQTPQYPYQYQQPQQLPMQKKPFYKKWWVWAIAAIAFFGIAGAAVGCSINNTAADTHPTYKMVADPTVKPTHILSAAVLYAAYDENEVAADQKYKNALVEITGTVHDIGKDVLGDAYITLDTGKPYYYVQCTFSKAQESAVASLSKGETVTVGGECRGSVLLSVLVRDCKLKETTVIAPENQSLSIPAVSTQVAETTVKLDPVLTVAPLPTVAPTAETAEIITDNVPAEYKSALTKATSYANTLHMSKVGIYEQLISEYGGKFTPEAAQYAIDNVKTDWNANALAKAESYANTLNMSKAGVYDQLISDNGGQFTKEEAQYAVDNIKVDWKANALAKAKSYQKTLAMSPASIHDQLVSEHGGQFTAEEADYAILHLND